MEVIQQALDTLSALRYLEVGVSDGVCFSRVSVPTKVGVDPITPTPLVTAEIRRPGASYFALTSDQFFHSEAPRALQDGVDVVFIDGLHTFDQAYRDCVNALRYLAPEGLLLVHDCLPISEAEARVAASYDEALLLNGPNWKSDWTGDVWKAIVTLRARHPDLDTRVLDCDHGVAVAYRGPNQAALSLSDEQIHAMTYADLAADPARLLGLCRPHYLLVALKQLAARRAAMAAHD